MYENEYENYMRSVLGYPINNTYNVNSFPYRQNNNFIKNNYEQMYPDIYKVLKPMVKKVCSNVRSMDVSPEIIENMTDEIYNNIESDTMDTTASNNHRANNRTTGDYKSGSSNNTVDKNASADSRGCCNNSTLKDLIKILIITQLISNCNNRPPQPPPYPPCPPPRPNCREFEGSSFSDNNFYGGF